MPLREIYSYVEDWIGEEISYVRNLIATQRSILARGLSSDK